MSSCQPMFICAMLSYLDFFTIFHHIIWSGFFSFMLAGQREPGDGGEASSGDPALISYSDFCLSKYSKQFETNTIESLEVSLRFIKGGFSLGLKLGK